MMPVLVFLFSGIFDFGRAFFAYTMSSNALRNALRDAVVIGYEGTDPPYSNCAAMRAKIKSAFFVGSPAITIQYEKADGTIISCPDGMIEVDDTLLENGDMLQITVVNRVALITPLINGMVTALNFNFRGQRTIVVNIPLTNNYVADTDYDGLDDTWEIAAFGNLNYTGTDDNDRDGCNNGCEETRSMNPLNADQDGDSLRDGDEVYVYDTNATLFDTDSDGLSDGEEINTYGTDPLDWDTDDDGLSDGDEIALGTNTGSNDSDGDGLTDGDEVNIHNTSPTNPDTDNDGLRDPDELFVYFTNPLLPDSDGDSITDGAEVNIYLTNPRLPDTDGDRLDDGTEVFTYGSSPRSTDSDSDGLLDGDEVEIHGTSPALEDTDSDRLNDFDEIYAYGTQPTNPDTDGDTLRDGDEIYTYYTSSLMIDTDGEHYPR